MKFAFYLMALVIMFTQLTQCDKATESAQTLLRIEDVLRSSQMR